jgi:hypothetical protein
MWDGLSYLLTISAQALLTTEHAFLIIGGMGC